MPIHCVFVFYPTALCRTTSLFPSFEGGSCRSGVAFLEIDGDVGRKRHFDGADYRRNEPENISVI